MQSINISIAEPCHQNWDAMLEAEKGRFCLSCQKQVVDFSTMADNDILQYISQSAGSTCGRFMPNQLERPITQRKEAHFSWKYILRILIPAFLISNKAKAQGMILYKPAHTAQVTNNAKNAASINGKIIDSLTGQPVAAATIKIKDYRTGTQSKEDGRFSLANPMALKNTVLEITSIGYETKIINTSDITTAEIKLIPASVILEPVIVTTSGYTKGKMGYYTTGAFITSSKIIKQVPLIQKITDSLMGKNHIKTYPNPVHRGNTVSIDMKGMEKGEYILQLCSAAGSTVMQQKIIIPATQFIFQWQISSSIAAGNYFLRISNTKNKLIYTSKVTAL
jgi:CarboxypepD_reg-like domain